MTRTNKPKSAVTSSDASPRLLVPLILLAVALSLRFVPGWVAPFTMVHFIGLGLGGALGVLGLLVWWTLSRRIPKRDRWLGLAFGVVLLALSFATAHPTMPQVLVMYGFVVLQVVFVAALVLTGGVPWKQRRWVLALSAALALLPWSLLRQDGQIGELTPELSARWSASAEDLFLRSRSSSATVGSESTPAAAALSATANEWPGFRGPARDGHARGVVFDTDWEKNPPNELWRRRVGPAWSSFAVAGDLVFTQEQRGQEEVVASYSLVDGHEIWVRASPGRFEEPAAGAGPRATPTLDGDRLFALGANGTLLALDSASGEQFWQRNLVEDVEAPLPTWGFTSSPLVVGRTVLVFAGADEGRSVVAYDRDTGDKLWASGHGAMSYGSPHLATLAGTEQILMATDVGLEAFDPQNGALLWEHRWPLTQMARIVQPVALDGDSLLLATGYGNGTRRLGIAREASGTWTVSQAWTSRFLKPYFKGLVCHEGTCYGFDGKIFTAIGTDDGERRWKGGRYGHGQVLLLPEMDSLLVLTEQGEVVLVEATPEAHREIARFQAIEGKTWNHPVITQGRLLVRNAEEAACFELPT